MRCTKWFAFALTSLLCATGTVAQSISKLVPVSAMNASLFAFAGIDSACQVILEANKKTLKTPFHAYSTMKVAGQSMKSEIIFVGGKEYSMAGGTWQVDPVNADEREKDQEENTAIAKASCQHVRDESIDGTAAGVYISHSPGGDQTIWIAKSTGVVLRSELDVARGSAKTHMEIRLSPTKSCAV
jgi:hypothetical protein